MSRSLASTAGLASLHCLSRVFAVPPHPALPPLCPSFTFPNCVWLRQRLDYLAQRPYNADAHRVAFHDCLEFPLLCDRPDSSLFGLPRQWEECGPIRGFAWFYPLSSFALVFRTALYARFGGKVSLLRLCWQQKRREVVERQKGDRVQRQRRRARLAVALDAQGLDLSALRWDVKEEHGEMVDEVGGLVRFGRMDLYDDGSLSEEGRGVWSMTASQATNALCRVHAVLRALGMRCLPTCPLYQWGHCFR